jgi:hypothetical protein
MTYQKVVYRNEKGQFAKVTPETIPRVEQWKRSNVQETVTYYHGTSYDNAEKIMKSGLGIKKKTLYLTEDKREAFFNFGNQQALLEVKLPKRFLKKGVVETVENEKWFLTNEKIPAKYVREMTLEERGRVVSREPEPKPELNYIVITSTSTNYGPQKGTKKKSRKNDKVTQWEMIVTATNEEQAVSIARGRIYERIDGTPMQHLWDWAENRNKLKSGVMITKEKSSGSIVFRKMTKGKKSPYSRRL